MNIIKMQINLNEYNISEDWGWFVDTEISLSLNQVVQVNEKYNKFKLINIINKLEKITEEDEQDVNDIESLNKFEKINIKYLMEICITTIIGGLVTYLSFIICY